jgi:rare lipoprotein A
MQTTKLVFVAMISLAMIDFSTGRSLNAATTIKIEELSFASTQYISSPTPPSGKPFKSMNGLAAVYSDKLTGRKTASGQSFCQHGLTAAHRSLPLGTKVLVTNIHNRKSVEVSINDRGPWRVGRVIDLTGAAAEKIGIKKTGKALVNLEIISAPSTEES